jgi:hypothetical protein
MTWSALDSSDGAILTPSVRAVFMLTTIWKCVGC